MWKPKERIKHSLLEGAWPSRQEAEESPLFHPIPVGPIQLRERTWVPAMVPWRATEEGFVTPQVLRWYERFAQGQPGALVVEATGIRDVPSGPLLRIGHDRFLPGLEELVETVHRASGGRTQLLIQLIDFLAVRRRPEPEKYLRRFLEIRQHHREALGESLSEEDLREILVTLPQEKLEDVLSKRELESYRFGFREKVTDLDQEHIRELPQRLPDLFASAAARAQKAGFDGVELHYAHAYTMASFLSALNQRTDGYGGSLENRLRLPLEVYHRVRQEVGPAFAVGCRYLSRDCLPGGSEVEDAMFFGVELARAGMDFLSLSRGGKFEDAKQPKIGRAVYPYTGPSGYECMPTAISDALGPFGRNIPAAARIRSAVRKAGMETPIVVAGGMSTFEQANEVLLTGQADVIAAARQSLADPDWFRKMRLGRGDEIRRCIFTNYCEGLDQMHKQVTCQLWDRLDLEEAGLARSHDGKRRLTPPSWEPMGKD
ncbi:MAG: NADH:flavin oxidoreductase [Deltaproteobacteria bacterium]|nr:NADH:flavin oxidoreductase [Deltaproteobacteria bacterium]